MKFQKKKQTKFKIKFQKNITNEQKQADWTKNFIKDIYI